MEDSLSCGDVGVYKKPIMSVGVEFVAWAESYWNLKGVYSNSVKNPAEKGGEVCPYSVVKDAFAKHIDEIIKQRFEHYL